MNKIDVILPCFGGFYGCDDLLDLEYQVDYLNDTNPKLYNKLQNKGLLSKLFDTIDNNIDYPKSYNMIAKKVISEIYEREIFRDYMVNITLVEVISPKYYNYSTDKIKVIFELSDEQLTSIENICFVSDRDGFDDFLIENYSSRDGFTSFITNNVNEFEIEYFELIDNDKSCFEVMLQYIFKKEHGEDYVQPYHIDSINECIEWTTTFSIKEMAKQILKDNK